MVQFGWPAGALTNRVPTFMRVMAVPGLSQLIATMPPSERTVRATFRRIGHGASLDAGRITQDDLDTYLALRYTDTMRNELALGRALVSPVHGVDPMLLPDAVLAKVVTPTLFTWGENDPFGDTTSACRLVSRLPDARLELMAGAGHAPWLDDLDHAVDVTRRFLEG